MIRNKAFWQRVLVVFSVFSFCMSMLGSLPESLRYGYELEAAADDVVQRLTVEQTLALYGTTITGSWYNANTGISSPISFHFQFASERWRPNDYTESPTYIKSVACSESVQQYLEASPFLIYSCRVDYDNGTYPWVPSSTADHANIFLNFSVDFSNLTFWDQWFMWSFGQRLNSNYNYCYIDSVINGSHYKQYAKRASSLSYISGIGYSIFPWYPAISTDTITESKLMYAGLIESKFGLDGTFNDVTGQSLTLQTVKDYEVDQSSLVNGVSINGSNMLFLFIGCPLYSGFNVFPETTPVTTAVTAGTTVSYQTYPTVDLSGLESGVGTMVQMQDENNYYERIQIDQLNMIIAQLNAIYQAMVERGEVPVSLTDADSYPTLNNTVLSGVNDAITTYTMAQLPADQIGNGATGLTSFMFFLNSGPWMAIGLFFIGFAIFSWFIFRGRGI